MRDHRAFLRSTTDDENLRLFGFTVKECGKLIWDAVAVTIRIKFVNDTIAIVINAYAIFTDVGNVVVVDFIGVVIIVVGCLHNS